MMTTYFEVLLQGQIPRSLVVSCRVDHHIQQKQMLGIWILGYLCVYHQAGQNKKMNKQYQFIFRKIELEKDMSKI